MGHRILFLMHPGTNTRDIFLDIIEGYEQAGNQVYRLDLGAYWSQRDKTANKDTQVACITLYMGLVYRFLMDNKIDLAYYHFRIDRVAGVKMIVSRTGYTGELGYELYFKGDEETAAHVWNELFKAGKEYDIQPAGLAARDSLRLEMGFCLYGNDIDETTNTIESGLGWITKLNKEDFIGRESLKKVKENGITRKLVAMISADKFFPRKGYDIVDGDKKIGTITSGTVSPVLEKPIALGYIDSDYKKVGTEINISIRGKEFAAKVVKLPFVKN